MEGEKVQAFYRGLGINPAWGQGGQPPGKTEEKTSTTLDLGKAFESVTNQNANLMGKLVEMSQGSKAGQTDPFLQYMMNELKDMRQALIAAKEHPQQVDPWQAIDTYATRYDNMMQKFKKDLNLPANMQLGTGNEQIAVQLKNLDLQQQERTLQFEERKHQWEVEREERKDERALRERQWQAEHNLKVQELKDKQAQSENATSWIQDLAGAFIGSVDHGAPSLNVGAQAPPEEPPVYRVKALHCGTRDCGTRVEIPAGAPEVTCPKCGMVYAMGDPGEQPAAPPIDQLPPVEAPRVMV